MGRLVNERVADRCAAAVIRLSGGLVVFLVAAIFVGIAAAALPLVSGARLDDLTEHRAATPAVAAGWIGGDGAPWWLEADGSLRRAGGSRVPLEAPWPVPLQASRQGAGGLLAVVDASGTGHVGVLRVAASAERRGAEDAVGCWRPGAEPLALPDGGSWTGVAARAESEGDVLLMAWGAGGPVLFRWAEGRRQWRELESPWRGKIVAAALGDELSFAAAVDVRGRLAIANLRTGRLEGVQEPPTPLVLVRFLVGGEALVAAAADGRISVLQRVPRVELLNRSETSLVVGSRRVDSGQRALLPDDRHVAAAARNNAVELEPAAPQWQEVRRLPPLGDRPTVLAASAFDRTFAVGGGGGVVALYHSTSGRVLERTRIAAPPPAAIAFGGRGDRLAIAGAGSVVFAALHNPHPEVGLRSLFLPVWYEGYAEPRLIWQSSGGSDDFEPKLSLWPLIVGTAKATAYAMLISVPLALLAAVYVSLLAPRWLQAVVKPTVELMAAVPTVVVGFLAALWLAPLLEAHLFQGLFTAGLLPLVVVVAIVLWRLLPLAYRNRAPDGSELLLLAVVGAVVVAVGWRVASGVETLLFAGDFPRWMFTEIDQRYDQRNAIVVGIALGFAVIPVIFTIAEDACSSVPKSLTRAARALGATRWQSALRMVVPAASPGLFAAVMLGLGRAIGETMIVLMASGNTPILGLGPFDGMRTMSAAIAFEIPEAAVGSTLYRVLFLAGLLLFVVTFFISTLADLVGRALRRRYAAF